jgi:hypothetical protein
MTLPPATDAAVVAWMRGHGWRVAGARFELDPQNEFRVWQEDEPKIGRSHALWIAESMVRHLSAEELVAVLDNEGMADEMRISYKVRIEERGDGYRVSVVPRPSGEMKRLDL